MSLEERGFHVYRMDINCQSKTSQFSHAYPALLEKCCSSVLKSSPQQPYKSTERSLRGLPYRLHIYTTVSAQHGILANSYVSGAQF